MAGEDGGVTLMQLRSAWGAAGGNRRHEGRGERKHFAQLAGYWIGLCKGSGTDIGKNPAGPDRPVWKKYTRVLAFASPDGSLADTGVRRAMDMSRIPFP